MALTDLHSYALTFRQLSQPASLERCGMDENILPIAILPYEAKPLVTIIHFDPADAFRGGPGTRLLLRMGSRDRAPRLCAHHLTCIDLNHFGDLWALLPLCRFSAAGMTGYPRAAAAGGRKAPRHEIAEVSDGSAAGSRCRQRYGELAAGSGSRMGDRRNRCAGFVW